MNTNDLQLVSKTLRADSGLVCFKVDLIKNNHEVVQSKTMSIDDYITLISGAERRKEPPLSLFLNGIPDGMVDGYISSIKGTIGAIIRIPAHKQQFSLAVDRHIAESRKTAFYMPMPNLIYLIAYVEGVRKIFNCFCYTEWNGPDTKLMQYPFGNVSAGAEICMGSIAINADDINSYMGLYRIIESSLYGITNGDYLEGDRVRLKKAVTQYEFCKELVDSNADVFPHDLLLEQPGNVLTVSDLQEKMHALFKNVSAAQG